MVSQACGCNPVEEGDPIRTTVFIGKGFIKYLTWKFFVWKVFVRKIYGNRILKIQNHIYTESIMPEKKIELETYLLLKSILPEYRM